MLGNPPRTLLDVTQGKTTFTRLKPPGALRKLFIDHISIKGQEKGVEDKTGCEHNTMCVFVYACLCD